jgi:hypothetical protein
MQSGCLDVTAGGYSPTSSFTSVVLPAPEGPTKAIVSPRATLKEMSVSAGDDAVWCWKLTWLNAR